MCSHVSVMWDAKALPCVVALHYCASTSLGVSLRQLQWSGKSLCVGPVERRLYFSLVLLCLLSFPPIPPPHTHFFSFSGQLAGSFALLVGSDLRTGYSEM